MSGHEKCPAPVWRSVPYLHVADVQRSLTFYAKLGFEPIDHYHDSEDRLIWASARAHDPCGSVAEVFFARATAPVIPEQQAVLLYMFSRDVAAVRSHLLDNGVHDAGHYCGQAGPNNGREVVFEPYHPGHTPEGELRIADPDAYIILVGQMRPRTETDAG